MRKENANPVLTVRNLTVEYATPKGPLRAVNRANLDLFPGEVLGLVGESGSGKTTATSAILQLLPRSASVTSGSIMLEDEDLLSLSEKELQKRRWARLSLVPQGAMNSLNPTMTVSAQIRDVILTHEGRSSREGIKKRILDLFDCVGLPHRIYSMFPHELSGGMKQRVCIAMAIALNPNVIIADESTSALDVVVQRVIAQTLLKIKADLNIAIIMIAHDMGLMAQMADRIAVMLEGEIVETATVHELFSSPQHQYSKRLITSVPSLSGLRRGVESRRQAINAASSESDLAHPLIRGGEIPSNPLLSLIGVKKSYGDVVALDHFDLTIPQAPATIVTVAGESGSGKSTLGNLVLGFTQPTEGKIAYNGRDITRASPAQLHDYHREVQAVFQDPFGVFNPFYRIQHVFNLVLRNFKLATPGSREAKKLVDEALEMVGLKAEDTLYRYPHQLSGGQRQRIMMARAYILKPRLIVADEPVSMVDSSLRSTILDVMLRMRDEGGISFLYITHDLSTAYQIGDELIVLYQGQVAERGDAQTIITEPSHPYVKLLINSVPKPDPNVRWEGRVALPNEDALRGLENYV